MAHDVFISYSSKNKTTADAVCAMLEIEGIRCWIAPRDVVPGMEWGECIIDAIQQARVMVLVFTADANASPQIRREVERAVNHGVAILPVRVEDVLPAKALEYFIGNVHWLDALTPPLEAHLKSLAGTIKMLLDREVPGNAAQAPPPAPGRISEPSAAAGKGMDVSAVARSGKTDGGRSYRTDANTPSSRSAHLLRILALASGIVTTAVALIFAAKFYLEMNPSWVARNGKRWVIRQSGTTSNLDGGFATEDGRLVWAVGANGAIIESEYGGVHWMARNSGTHADLASITGTKDGKKLWAVGASGTILESDDAGAMWIRRQSGTQAFLTSIAMANDGKLCAVGRDGANGVILESGDGGADWSERAGDAAPELTSVFARRDGAVQLWAVGAGGAILESDDGGITWTPRNSQTDKSLLSITGRSDGAALWVAGESGTLVESDDGGASWSARSDPNDDIRTIFSADGRRFWALDGYHRILESTYGINGWKIARDDLYPAPSSLFGSGDGKHLWTVGYSGEIAQFDN